MQKSLQSAKLKQSLPVYRPLGLVHFSRHQFAADPDPTLTEPAIPTNTILVSAKLHSGRLLDIVYVY